MMPGTITMSAAAPYVASACPEMPFEFRFYVLPDLPPSAVTPAAKRS